MTPRGSHRLLWLSPGWFSQFTLWRRRDRLQRPFLFDQSPARWLARPFFVAISCLGDEYPLSMAYVLMLTSQHIFLYFDLWAGNFVLLMKYQVGTLWSLLVTVLTWVRKIIPGICPILLLQLCACVTPAHVCTTTCHLRLLYSLSICSCYISILPRSITFRRTC